MNDTEKNGVRTLSVEEWHKLSITGADIPTKITLMGDSMRPLIRRQVDKVTIIPLRRSPLVGDIVLFTDGTGRYVVHRVMKTENDTVTTIGDHCTRADRPVKLENVWGLVTKVERGKHTLQTDCNGSRLFGKFWIALFPLRMCYYKAKNLMKRRGQE